jgi:hypothetical protein
MIGYQRVRNVGVLHDRRHFGGSSCGYQLDLDLHQLQRLNRRENRKGE